ncbi:agamous-like MADS-box protein AGL62 [Populus alba]|uniref:Agamous-like MADS-box protein AGL62 n=2 Tax=Populus alba TaxID=43335 RepID=A0A4U5R3F0_POPAL|nr:agamous-like MADS-box protein AGL62 [Populus alba]TKS17781.1 agamous-like MADS-box protein AGL62 [Populus alba]
MVNKKPTMGRQKIKIEKIAKKSHLQVTFSKRRAGLFKKASELSTLCGVDVAMIVFSPAQKAFSFGHPTVDSMMHRFLTGSRPPPPPSSGLHQLIETRRDANVHEQNMQLTQILNQLEAEKKNGEVLDQMRKVNRSRCCWEAPVEELELHELEQLRGALEELKKTVAKQVNNVLIQSTSSLPFLAVNGVGEVGNLGTKLEIDNASAALHFNNFGYAQKIC